MQQLTSHRQKKYQLQVFFYITLLIIFLVILVTVGVKLLVNGTLFITSITNPDKVENRTTNLMAPPELTVPDATNSAALKITGKGDPKKDLTIFVNNDIAHQIFLTDENFEATLTLVSGENTIYAQLQDPKTKKIARSETYTVTYSDAKPKLDIFSPTNGSKLYKDEVLVEGQTDKERSVTINGKPVVVESEGKFSKAVHLTEGENKIVIVALDSAGNSETKEVSVTYERD